MIFLNNDHLINEVRLVLDFLNFSLNQMSSVKSLSSAETRVLIPVTQNGSTLNAF